MSTRIELLTPVGRLVQGSLYTGSSTDLENRPLIYKTGPNAGQPRTNFWFHVAIEKGKEPHWNITEWGQKIWNVGQLGFPSGQANSPQFAWKIIDGDSQIPNIQGHRPCDAEGYAYHWILKFSGSFAPSLFNENGTIPLTEPNGIQLGDYIQVYGFVEDNKSMQQPGVYLNHSMVARSGYGARIIVGADPKSVGFGNSNLPVGASKNPIAQVFVTPDTSIGNSNYGSAQTISVTPSPPPPYPQILTPTVPVISSIPVIPQKVMTQKANGASYEQLISIGWTDALLIEHALMMP